MKIEAEEITLNEKMGTRILKWTIVLTIGTSFLMSLLGIFSQYYPWYIGILLFVLSAMLTYVYSMFSEVLIHLRALTKKTGLIVDKLGTEAIEVFRNREELFRRMLEITVNSQMVCTQMFSDPPTEISEQMEKYFQEVESYIKRNPQMIFRRITTLGNERKVRWLMRLLYDMVGVQNFSLAFIEADHQKTPLLCVHLVQKEGRFFTFIFHTVPASGDIYAFLIQSSDVGRVVLDFYNGLWSRSLKLMEGRQLNKDTIRQLAESYRIENSPEYLELKGKINSI